MRTARKSGSHIPLFPLTPLPTPTHSVLSQFAFHLSLNYEIDSLSRQSSAGRGVAREAHQHRLSRAEGHSMKPLRRLTASLADPMNDSPGGTTHPYLGSQTFASSPVDTSQTHSSSNNSVISKEDILTLPPPSLAPPENHASSHWNSGDTGDMLVKYHLFSWEL